MDLNELCTSTVIWCTFKKTKQKPVGEAGRIRRGMAAAAVQSYAMKAGDGLMSYNVQVSMDAGAATSRRALPRDRAPERDRERERATQRLNPQFTGFLLHF